MAVFGVVPTAKETKAKIKRAEEMAMGSKATKGPTARKPKDAKKKRSYKKSPYS